MKRYLWFIAFVYGTTAATATIIAYLRHGLDAAILVAAGAQFFVIVATLVGYFVCKKWFDDIDRDEED